MHGPLISLLTTEHEGQPAPHAPDELRRARQREQWRKAYAANPGKYQARNAAWRKANPDKTLAMNQKYNANHKETRSVYRQAYRAANREALCAKDKIYNAVHSEERREKARAYRAANPLKVREQQRQSRHKHPDVHRAIKQRKRARKANSPINNFTASQWREMKALYGHRCAYCHRKMKCLTMDHITPLSKGGAHTASNIVPACQSCNFHKYTGPPPVPVQPVLLLNSQAILTKGAQ